MKEIEGEDESLLLKPSALCGGSEGIFFITEFRKTVTQAPTCSLFVFIMTPS